MQKLKRNERIGSMIKTLSDSPNKIYTLSSFSHKFQAAKSTISEDIEIAKNTLERFEQGTLETITGAAGGVKYIPERGKDSTRKFVEDLCKSLSDRERILTGGFLYMLDILSNPELVARMGEILAMWFYNKKIDFVVTVETKGIPVAMMAARALNVPLLIARRDMNITDGSLVTINYVTGSKHRIQTMSLSRRVVKQGRRALIIDDFMKGGGTAKGLIDMMKEFSVAVAGVGVVMSTGQPERKLVSDYKSLMVLNNVDEIMGNIEIVPSKWV